MSGSKSGTIFAFVCGVAAAIAIAFGCVFVAIYMASQSDKQNAAKGIEGADTWIVWFGVFLCVVGLVLAVFLGRLVSKLARKLARKVVG